MRKLICVIDRAVWEFGSLNGLLVGMIPTNATGVDVVINAAGDVEIWGSFNSLEHLKKLSYFVDTK